jgi:L-arabinose 1- dehydrogenase
MRVGVIGLGVIADFFLAAIDRDPAVQLTAVCDVNDGRLRMFRDRGVRTFLQYEELAVSGAADAVIIALPNHLHAPAIRAALAAGVHVCSEKPLAPTAGQAHDLVRLSRETGTVLWTAFHRRYNRNLGPAREAIHRRDQVAMVVIRYMERINDHIGSDLWTLNLSQAGGGCLLDNGPNAIDLASQLLGPLQALRVRLGDMRDGMEFAAEVDLRSEDGIGVRVSLDWAWPAGELKDVTICLVGGRHVSVNLLTGFPAFKSSLSHEYAAILTDFQRVVARGGAHGEEGARIVELIDTSYGLAGRNWP